ncbi:MAG: hypothetical protein R8M11_01915 [Gallionella sp.]
MWHKVNMFMAWFFIPQTLAMGWVAAIGRVVLELLGVDTYEGDLPGRLVGAILLIGAVYLFLHFLRALPPVGNPKGNGFRFGHRMLLAANVLAGLLFIFQLTFTLIDSHNLYLVLNKFTTAFGYWVMAMWMVGFSFLYQSAQPASLSKTDTAAQPEK